LKKKAKYCDNIIQDYFCTFVLDSKKIRAESKIFFQPNPNVINFDSPLFFYPPPPFLVSNERKKSKSNNQSYFIAKKQTNHPKPSK